MSDPKKMRVSQWAISDGYVRLEWPDPLSADDVADLEAFIAIVMKGIKRRQVAREAGIEVIEARPSDA